MISLTIPPDPSALSVLRATASAIGARADLTLDQLDDVRMAVEEAAVVLLKQGQPITMRVDPAVAPLVVTISIPDAITLTPDPEALSWMVLGGVTEAFDVHHQPDETGIALTFATARSDA